MADRSVGQGHAYAESVKLAKVRHLRADTRSNRITSPTGMIYPGNNSAKRKYYGNY